MKKTTIAVFAVLAAALAIAGAGAALAASGAFSPEDTSRAVIDDAAAQLGIEPADLSAALEQALKNQIDEAVDEGRLTEKQAEALKERIDSADVPLVFGGLGPLGFGGKLFGPHFADLDVAAAFLGLSESELRSQLADGKSLAEIAKAEGKSVDGLVQALVRSAREQIDEAVEKDKLSEEQAAKLKEDVGERITELVNRELRFPQFPHKGFDRGFKDGFGFRFDFGERSSPDFHWFGRERPDFFSGPRA